MEFKTDALLLRAADYGENDRMVTLLTAERGKLGAAMKGVRRAGAKLKAAAQPLCFAEYVLAERAGRYTVTQAAIHESFSSVGEDLVRFYAASAVLEVSDAIALEGMECGPLLVSAVEALKCIESEEEPPMSAIDCFLLQALAFAGYPVSAGACPVCGKRPSGRMRFDFSAGAFLCGGCGEGVPASESTYLAVRALMGKEEAVPGDGYVRAMRLLSAYLSHETEVSVSSLRALDGLL